MFWILLPYVFAGLFVLLYLAIAVILLRKYFRTRDTGLVWLCTAVVIWPLITTLLGWGERVAISHLVRHQPVGFFPFSLVERGEASIWGLVRTLNLLQQLIGVCLLLVSVTYLYKSKNEINRTVTRSADSCPGD